MASSNPHADQHSASPQQSSDNERLSRHDLNYPGDTEERNAARVRMNDTGTRQEPPGVQPDIAAADKRTRTGEESERVRNTPPFGDWDTTGPVSPDPELERPAGESVDQPAAEIEQRRG